MIQFFKSDNYTYNMLYVHLVLTLLPQVFRDTMTSFTRTTDVTGMRIGS